MAAPVTNELTYDVLKDLLSTVQNLRGEMREGIGPMTHSEVALYERRLIDFERDMVRVRRRLEFADTDGSRPASIAVAGGAPGC
jgi:hypothetical protein